MPLFNNEGLGVITEGCKTTHGGYVLPVSRPFQDYIGGVEPRSVIVQGDMVYCPKCKGNFPIEECDSTRTWNDKGMVFHGHRAACGAMIISDHPPQNPALAEALLQAAEGKPLDSVPYDEQLQFVMADSSTLMDVPYTLTLEDGSTVEGRTDEEGKTERVSTETPLKIVRAELTPNELQFGCACAADHAQSLGGSEGDSTVMIELKNVQTNDKDVGSSVVKQEVPSPDVRSLTAGEIAMATLVFKDAIDYSKVKVHRGGNLLWHPDLTGAAITPNGEIYFPTSHYKDDFSISDNVEYIVWFIHELAHVWQYQLDYPVVRSGAKLMLKGGYSDDNPNDESPAFAYRYELEGIDKDKTLPDFNMEQQAELISHYFAGQYLGVSKYATRLPKLASILSEFLGNPKNKMLLPNNTKVEHKP